MENMSNYIVQYLWLVLRHCFVGQYYCSNKHLEALNLPNLLGVESNVLVLVDIQIDAVPDLRDHVYKAVARMLLNVGG